MLCEDGHFYSEGDSSAITGGRGLKRTGRRVGLPTVRIRPPLLADAD